MRIVAFILTGLFLIEPVFAAAQDFDMYRWNENYSDLKYIKDRNLYDQLKYVELDDSIYVSLGGSIRERLNIYENDRFGLQGVPDGNLLLHRSLLHADLFISNNFRTFIEIGTHLADGKNLLEGPYDEDKVDITQAFFDVNVDNMQLRIGRQEMKLGSARLVGVRNGPNVRRAFDGIRFDTSWNNFKLRFFALSEVVVNQGVFDNYTNDDELLWGIYVTRNTNITNVDFYYIGYYSEETSFVNANERERETSFARHTYLRQEKRVGLEF